VRFSTRTGTRSGFAAVNPCPHGPYRHSVRRSLRRCGRRPSAFFSRLVVGYTDDGMASPARGIQFPTRGIHILHHFAAGPNALGGPGREHTTGRDTCAAHCPSSGRYSGLLHQGASRRARISLDQHRGHLPMLREPQLPHCFIDLGRSFAEYEAKFSSKTRSTIRRKIKKYAEYCGGRIPWKTYGPPTEMNEF